MEGVAWSAQRIFTVVNLGFLDRSRYFSFQVAPRLSSRGWVDPVPDSLLLRKSGSAGNRTRDLWIYSQKLWPLDHRGGQKYPLRIQNNNHLHTNYGTNIKVQVGSRGNTLDLCTGCTMFDSRHGHELSWLKMFTLYLLFLATGWTAFRLEFQSSPLHVFQTGPGAHSASCPTGTGVYFPGDKAAEAWS
jgi:hypothetical protein